MSAANQPRKSSHKKSFISSLAGSAATLDPTLSMPGAFYETAMIMPGMEKSAMPRRSQAPRQSPKPQRAAMASQTTLVSEAMDHIKETNSIQSDDTPSSRPNFAKRILKRIS